MQLLKESLIASNEKSVTFRTFGELQRHLKLKEANQARTIESQTKLLSRFFSVTKKAGTRMITLTLLDEELTPEIEGKFNADLACLLKLEFEKLADAKVEKVEESDTLYRRRANSNKRVNYEEHAATTLHLTDLELFKVFGMVKPEYTYKEDLAFKEQTLINKYAGLKDEENIVRVYKECKNDIFSRLTGIVDRALNHLHCKKAIIYRKTYLVRRKGVDHQVFFPATAEEEASILSTEEKVLSNLKVVRKNLYVKGLLGTFYEQTLDILKNSDHVNLLAYEKVTQISFTQYLLKSAHITTPKDFNVKILETLKQSALTKLANCRERNNVYEPGYSVDEEKEFIDMLNSWKRPTYYPEVHKDRLETYHELKHPLGA
jgi:hypothetical protein